MVKTPLIRHTYKPAAKHRLKAGLRISRIMRMPESDVAAYISSIEKDPLFKKLFLPERKDEKIIRFRRYCNSGYLGPCYPLNERTVSATDEFDAQSFLEGSADIIPLVKRIGEERFKKYFLYGEFDLCADDLSRETGLSRDEMGRVFDFINSFSVQREFTGQGAKGAGTDMHYSKVASIVKNLPEDKNEAGFNIMFFSPQSARGRYIVDYEKLKVLRSGNALTKEEASGIGKLVMKLELLNMKKDVMFKIMDAVCLKQRRYLESGEWKDRAVFTQRELASFISVNPSTISRCVFARSIVAPWGEELPLGHFLPNNREICEGLIGKYFGGRAADYSDTELSRLMKKKFNLNVSRRSIGHYRKNIRAA